MVCTKYGPPEVLQLKDVPKPVPKSNEVLIRVYAAAVTVSDTRIRSSGGSILMSLVKRLLLGFRRPRRSILGSMLAGEIEAVGKNVKRFTEGDQVYGLNGLRMGAYAEYVCMPEAESMTRRLALKPKTMSYEEAAAVPYGALLASHFMNKGNIRSGQKVLIYGASGAIGTTAVQLAKYAGAEVTAVCSAANFPLVRSLGAEKTIDYTTQDSFSDEERYDFIFDAAGRRKSSPLKLQCRNALTQGGKYVSVDDAIAKSRPETLVRMKEIIEAGHFRAVIDRCYPLEQIAGAHQYVEQGHAKGSVVIRVVITNSA